MDFKAILFSLIGILNEMSPYILLGFLIAGLLHVFVNEKTLTAHLSGRGLKPVLKAAAIGIPLPLCSCGVLPTAVSLRRQGASKGATTSFLIATPQTGVDSIAATYSLLGLPFALIRPIAALAGAVFGGALVGKVCADDSPGARPSSEACGDSCERLSVGKKITRSVKYGFVDMIDTMGKWLVIGLVIAALVTVLVPDSLFEGVREYPLVAMIVMVLVAVPMYICATGSIPIAMSLMLKGLTPGVAFVLLMAGPAANFASILVLNRAIGRKATALYVAAVVITAIAFGLVIDYLLPARWFAVGSAVADHCGHLHLGVFETLCSAVLVVLLAASAVRLTFLRKRHKQTFTNKNEKTEMTKTFIIKGMSCAHCRATAERAISSVPGVETVEVDLGGGKATVAGNFDAEKVMEAVRLAGFDIE